MGRVAIGGKSSLQWWSIKGDASLGMIVNSWVVLGAVGKEDGWYTPNDQMDLSLPKIQPNVGGRCTGCGEGGEGT